MDNFKETLSRWVGDAEAEHYILEAYKAEIDAKANSRADAIMEQALDGAKDEIRQEAVKETYNRLITSKGVEVSRLSSFISESVIVDGQKLVRNMFISDFPYYDPINENERLIFDDLHQKWVLKNKNGKTKLVSTFVTIAILVVNARGPGLCSAYVVFIKDKANPLIFRDGCITPSALKKQTPFHHKGLGLGNREYYYETFLRSLCMCNNVFFITLPQHAGWNITPDGRRIFVSAENMIPILSDLFCDEKE